MRSLTQTEAEARAALLTVTDQHVAVDLTDLPTGDAFAATSTIRFQCREPGAASFVDCCAEVRSATLNGRALGEAADGRLELTDLETHNVLVVETVQTDTTDGEGVHRAVDPADGEVYLWTTFEPDEARFAYACFDQPDLKTPITYVVTAPAAWRVVSNMAHTEVVAAGDGADARTWTFAPTPPLSTYNPVVLAGPLHEIRRTVGGHDLGIMCRRSLAPVLEREADDIFTVTAQGLEFFDRVFGLAFPEEKYDQVFMPDMGGAMENYGCVTFSDSFLTSNVPTPAELDLRAKVVLHEMAHMWFGNMVTMRWWDDLWLNEAFAEFACNWAAMRATAYTDGWAVHIADDALQAYLTDQGPTSHPIYQPIHDVAQAASIFDAITYPKGATVLFQLMTYLGEETFSAGMKSYFARHAWGNTTLQDLVDALAQASGRDLDAWRAGWIATAGTDRLRLEHTDDGHVLHATGPHDGPPRPHVLGIGCYRRTPDGLVREDLVLVEVAGERTPVELPEGCDLYLVNDDGLTFATVRSGEKDLDQLLTLGADLPTAVSRAVAVVSVWDMLVCGEATAREVVGLLTAVLEKETALAVFEPYATRLVEAAELWAPDADRDDLARRAAATLRAVAEDPMRRQVALRMLARVGDLADLAWLDEHADGDVDLLWRSQVRRSELGHRDDEAVAGLLERDPDPEAWVRALAVRSAAATPEAKEEFWQRAVVERKVPMGRFGAVATAFWRPGQEDVLAPYVARCAEVLPHVANSGMMWAMVLGRRLFPSFAVDEAGIDRILADADDLPPVVRVGVLARADETRRMLRSRATR